MLSIFPQILFLAPLSATLLRVTAGVLFLYLAYDHFADRRGAAKEVASIISGGRVLFLIYSLLEFFIALGLILGFWTQAAALAGAILAFTMLPIRRRLHDLKPFSDLAYALLAIICLSLVFTGAGAFAFDLPL